MEPLIPPSMQELISLAFEIGLGNRSPEEKRKYLTDKQAVIHEGILLDFTLFRRINSDCSEENLYCSQ